MIQTHWNPCIHIWLCLWKKEVYLQILQAFKNLIETWVIICVTSYAHGQFQKQQMHCGKFMNIIMFHYTFNKAFLP